MPGFVDMRCDAVDESTDFMNKWERTGSCCCRAKVSCGASASTRALRARKPRAPNACARAVSVCESLPGCVGYVLNEEASWATFKAAPVWWRAHPDVSACRGLARRAKEALSNPTRLSAADRTEISQQWARLFCRDYTAGNRMRRPRGRGLIFDVGMHVGDDTDYYLQSGFDVVAVEANPNVVASARLRPSISLALRSGQLRIVQKAVVARPSAANVSFYMSRSEGSFTSSMFDPKSPDFRQVSVASTTCAQLIEAYGTPWYIKIDIEGADAWCVQSLGGGRTAEARRALPPYISTENPKLVDELASRGYSRFKLVDQQITRRGYTQFSGGLPEECLAHDPDPFIDNRGYGWRTAASIRHELDHPLPPPRKRNGELGAPIEYDLHASNLDFGGDASKAAQRGGGRRAAVPPPQPRVQGPMQLRYVAPGSDLQ